MTKILPDCENCGTQNGIRKIIWGLPAYEPDLNVFLIGGCIPDENPASIKCIECGWEDKQFL